MQTKDFKTVTNASGFATKTIGGRNYLVVPAVPVREQVMNHYLVPAKELEFAQIWNGIPITIRHPVRNNGSVNVPEPDVAIIGKFYNGQWDENGHRVLGEYWIDVDEAMKYVEGQYILNSVYLGQVLETSTGYWADEEPAPGEFDGRAYETIHRNLRPDHIAILVDATGACSVADGCGVNRNSLVYKLRMNECMYQQGGAGSGDFGHGGRPGEVGGSSPRTKLKPSRDRTSNKTLNKSIKAYYVTPGDKASKYSKGYNGRVSLMSRAKAETLYESMTRGGFDPTAFEISLRNGSPYIGITSSSITVPSIPAGSIRMISIEELKSRTGGPFKNNFLLENNCGCSGMVKNEAGSGTETPSLTDKISEIRSAFYDAFMQPQKTPYIEDIFDDHCLVEYDGDMYNAYFSTSTDGEIQFDAQDKWKKMELVEAGTTGADTTGGSMDMMDNESLPASCYLVYADGVGHLPVKDASGKPNHTLMGAAWAALHGGYRGNKYAGPNKTQAIAKLKALYAREKMPLPSANKKGDDVSRKSGNSTETKSKKESTMSNKFSVNTLLDMLRGKGVQVQVNNEDEVDGEMELEVAEGTQEQKLTVAEPLFNADEVKALKALAATDFTKLNAMIDKLPAVVEMAQNAEAEKTARKNELIGVILNTAGNVFSKEELDAMTLPMLTKVSSQLSFSYSGVAGGAPAFTNQSEEYVGLPNISFEKE